jgi:hypothetical protein
MGRKRDQGEQVLGTARDEFPKQLLDARQTGRERGFPHEIILSHAVADIDHHAIGDMAPVRLLLDIGFGNDDHGIAEFQTDFQTAPCNLLASFHRLVTIGHAAHAQQLRPPLGAGKFSAQ